MIKIDADGNKHVIRKDHVHKPRGKTMIIMGWKKRILLCYQCGRLLNNITLGHEPKLEISTIAVSKGWAKEFGDPTKTNQV